MKQLFTYLFVVIVSITVAFSQSELIIEPGPSGTINETIFGDTLANGERVDSNRVYVLRRGFPYLISSTIQYSDFHLTIKSEDTTGIRPLLLVDPGAGSLSQIFRTGGTASLSLEGLHISGLDLLAGYNGRIIRFQSDNATLRINDCLVEEASQSFIRLQGDNASIYITNSVVRNIGRPTDPNNGRFIDNRGNPLDTLWMENNVVYNVTSRFYRNGSGNSLDWARINQNTFWGAGQRGFSFGDLTTLSFTNNILYNAAFTGNKDSAQWDSASALYWIEADTFDMAAHSFTISHNNFHADSEYVNLFPLVNGDGTGGNYIAMDTFLFNPSIQAGVDASGMGGTNIDEDILFTDPPLFHTQFVTENATDTAMTDNGVPGANPWDLSDLPADTNWSPITAGTDRYSAVHDFTYRNTYASYTAGDQGQPVGANMSIMTAITDLFVENNILYYPNPVTDELFIQNLDRARFKSIDLYALSGQKLKSIRNLNEYVMRFNTSDLPMGIYLLTLVDEQGKVSSKKIVKR